MKRILKMIVWASFAFYLLVVFYLVFFRYHRGFISELSLWEYARFQMNLIPFKTIAGYSKAIFDGSMNLDIPVTNLLGNLLMCFPWGIYLPLLCEKMKHWKKYLAVTIVFLLGIELVQFFTRRGSFDIDDLILNLAGAMLGFLMWKTRILLWFEKLYRIGGCT